MFSFKKIVVGGVIGNSLQGCWSSDVEVPEDIPFVLPPKDGASGSKAALTVLQREVEKEPEEDPEFPFNESIEGATKNKQGIGGVDRAHEQQQDEKDKGGAKGTDPAAVGRKEKDSATAEAEQKDLASAGGKQKDPTSTEAKPAAEGKEKDPAAVEEKGNVVAEAKGEDLVAKYSDKMLPAVIVALVVITSIAHWHWDMTPARKQYVWDLPGRFTAYIRQLWSRGNYLVKAAMVLGVVVFIAAIPAAVILFRQAVVISRLYGFAPVMILGSMIARSKLMNTYKMSEEAIFELITLVQDGDAIPHTPHQAMHIIGWLIRRVELYQENYGLTDQEIEEHARVVIADNRLAKHFVHVKMNPPKNFVFALHGFGTQAMKRYMEYNGVQEVRKKLWFKRYLREYNGGRHVRRNVVKFFGDLPRHQKEISFQKLSEYHDDKLKENQNLNLNIEIMGVWILKLNIEQDFSAVLLKLQDLEKDVKRLPDEEQFKHWSTLAFLRSNSVTFALKDVMVRHASDKLWRKSFADVAPLVTESLRIELTSTELESAVDKEWDAAKRQYFSDLIVERYVPGKKLGSGAFGEVMLHTLSKGSEIPDFQDLRSTPKSCDTPVKCPTQHHRSDFATTKLSQVARKCPRRVEMSPREWASWHTERSILAQISTSPHPNVLQYVTDGWSAQADPCMFTEYFPGKELTQYLKGTKLHASLSEQDLLNIMRQIVAGVQHIHSMGYLHSDVKPDNILMSEDKRVKIIDLGMAVSLEDLDIRRIGVRGTPLFGAPEYFVHNKNPTPAVDIFSIGVTCLHLLVTEKTTIHSKIEVDLPKKKQEILSLLAKIENQKLKDLLGTMLDFDPLNRPTLKQVLIELQGLE